MEIAIDRAADAPIYRQIVDQIRNLIRTGALPAGSRLPPVRQIAAELGLTRLTVYSAYSELQAQGLVDSHVGRGTFVAAVPTRRPGRPPRPDEGAEWTGEGLIADLLRVGSKPGTISFAQAFPASDTIPVRELGRAFQSVMRRADSFEYGSIQGRAELREQIVPLLHDRGWFVTADELLITSGGQQALDTILRTCTEPGDTLAVEAPTYPGVLELAAHRRLNVVPVPTDDGGVRVDALEAVCEAHRPSLLYLVPACGNPTGRTLAPERRSAILRLAADHSILVIEDDTYGLLGFTSTVPPALKSADDRGNVLYVMSFSKMLAPALRLGAILAPMSLLPKLAAAKGSSDLVCSSLLQLALAEYLRQGHLLPHVRSVRELYRTRCDAMLAAIARYMPACTASEPDGGLSLWVRLPDGVVERSFVSDALDAGVAVVPGEAFFPDAQGGPSIRLSFGMHPPERMAHGVRVLGQVLDAHRRRGSLTLSLARGAAGPLV